MKREPAQRLVRDSTTATQKKKFFKLKNFIFCTKKNPDSCSWVKYEIIPLKNLFVFKELEKKNEL